jgi:hypothetical protein
MARTRNSTPIQADVKWVDGQWSATALTPDGDKVSAPARSPTKALNRLQSQLERTKGGSTVVVEPKYHVPKPVAERYSTFSKKLKLFMELKEYVLPERAEIAKVFTEDYNMPLSVVSKLVGLSPARLGVLFDKMAAGQSVVGQLGRPKKVVDDDDD